MSDSPPSDWRIPSCYGQRVSLVGSPSPRPALKIVHRPTLMAVDAQWRRSRLYAKNGHLIRYCVNLVRVLPVRAIAWERAKTT
jgi:hypothetical protein